MKLITKQTNKRNHKPEDVFSINKGSLSIRPELIKKLGLKHKQSCVGIGYNETNRLCLFITREEHSELMTLKHSDVNKIKPGAYATLYGTLSVPNQQALVGLIGDYTYQEPILKNNVFELVLLRKG